MQPDLLLFQNTRATQLQQKHYSHRREKADAQMDAT